MVLLSYLFYREIHMSILQIFPPKIFCRSCASYSTICNHLQILSSNNSQSFTVSRYKHRTPLFVCYFVFRISRLGTMLPPILSRHSIDIYVYNGCPIKGTLTLIYIHQLVCGKMSRETHGQTAIGANFKRRDVSI